MFLILPFTDFSLWRISVTYERLQPTVSTIPVPLQKVQSSIKFPSLVNE